MKILLKEFRNYVKVADETLLQAKQVFFQDFYIVLIAVRNYIIVQQKY